jgi:uncharacterized membrane protein
LIIGVHWEGIAATGHVLAAVTAIVVGAVVLYRPKGVGIHRLVGSAYILSLVVVDIAALAVHREATFGVFHVLAVLSLLTIVVGVLPLVLGSRSPVAVSNHAYCMTWSYAGLIAAGSGQLAAGLLSGQGSWAVPAVISAVLAFSGLLIFLRVPPILGDLFAGPPSAGTVSG